MAIKACHVWACISQPQSPEALLKQLLIYNTKHTSCSAKQHKITLCAFVCVHLCVRLDVEHSEAVVGTTLNKTSRMH